jgi:hypothetical protein
MNELYFKLKNNLGLSLILLIGLGVEFSNFQSMFFRFMSQYRPDWGAINHIPAGFLSAFLLLCIVIFGIRRQTITSWFLALITCVVSFAVYSRLNLVWKWEEMHEVHFVVLILSGMLPMLVAYTTHQITNDQESEWLLRENALRKALAQQNMQQQLGKSNRYYARNYMMKAEKPRNQQTKSQIKSQQKNQNTQKKPPIIVDDFEDEDDDEMFEDEIFWSKNASENRQEDLQVCEQCFMEFSSKNPHTKYCSDDCRLVALRRKQRSDFYTLRDDFEKNGSMEWVNPQGK